MITVQQVKDAVEETFDGYESEFYGELSYSSKGIELNGLGVATGVGSEGGHEGGGEYMDVVFQLGDQLFRMTGTHDSWEGSSWDGDLEEVEAYQELVTKYRRK